METSIEIYKLTKDRGKIIISFSDVSLSTGLLHLYPDKALDRHNRPVTEQLAQIAGTCTMKLFDGEKLFKEVVLNEGDTLIIPANQHHIHSNQSTKDSITLWKFEGDITEVIKKIREDNELL